MIDTGTIQDDLESLLGRDVSELDLKEARRLFDRFLAALETGEVRAAEPSGNTWRAHEWVKRGILFGFRIGAVVDVGGGFLDKDTYPVRRFSTGDGVRVVPGGSAVRAGAHLGSGVVCMPPMYVNVGAFVGAGSMVDSHVLVGSCAQIGERVHLSAAVQIGGVLEPPGALPVIVEDEAFIGGGCGIYEGCIVREKAVLAPGVTLTGSTTLYDIPNGRALTRDPASGVLEVPHRAVVVPGSRKAAGGFAREHGLSLYAPVIVKYRDSRTDGRTALEEALR